MPTQTDKDARIAELEQALRDIWHMVQHFPAPVGKYEKALGAIQRKCSEYVHHDH